MMRIMGLDLGTKNIGVAISDELSIIAQGREVIKRTSDLKVIERIKGLLDEYNIEVIVLGLPINMDGSMGLRAEDSTRFAEKLKEQLEVKVELWDERLSTKEAEAVMLEASLSRAKRKKSIDKLAAQLILQGYLDNHNREIDDK